MNHWKETAEVLTRLAAVTADGRRAALATVVHIDGSAYRRPGAKLLIVRHYNAGDGSNIGGLGLGCTGLVDIFVQPATREPRHLWQRREHIHAG
jgi:xanthine/CO dehydrogenase XdhC/CoxF family maturation factor